MKKLFALIILAFAMNSCENKTNKEKSAQTQNNSSLPALNEANTIPSEFKSPLRQNKKLELGKIYTDIVKYVKFDDNGDNWLVVVEKSSDTIGLIYNKDQFDLFSGEEIEIKWKMDSIRNAGDSEFLDYREFLISSRKIKSNFSEKKFSKIKNQSFVISCGTGCAMTYNVKEIKQMNPTSIKVTFNVESYIDEQSSETFVETYIFYYGNINIIQKIMTYGKSENIMNRLPESALQSFEDFALKLMK